MTDDEFIAMIKRHEGVKPYVYSDSLGYLTIGVGRLVDHRKGGHLSDDEINLLLMNDIQGVVDELDSKLTWWRQLSQNRQAALTDLGFNMGVPDLLTFTTFLGLLKSGEFTKAADDLLTTLWAKQVQTTRRDDIVGLIRNG